MAVKAREIRVALNGRVDPGVINVLEALAEDAHVVRQQILTMAQEMDRMINIITDFTAVATNMKNVVDQMKGISREELGQHASVGSIPITGG
jgi:hypothetical protein